LRDCGRLAQFKSNVRMLRPKPANNTRQTPIKRAAHIAQTHIARSPGGHILRRRDRQFRLAKCFTGVLHKRFSRTLTTTYTIAAFNQDDIKILFQLTDRTGKWRLRHIQSLRSAMKMELFGNGHELRHCSQADTDSAICDHVSSLKVLEHAK